jgi:hypothetical protein
MRREPGGPVIERLEPEDFMMMDPLAPLDDWIYGRWNRPLLREALYNHYQHEKYQSACPYPQCVVEVDQPAAVDVGWWSLPDRSLRQGEILYIVKEHGAHIWDQWNYVVWESPRGD